MISFDRPVVCVDIETTSLDPYDRLAWDIGMVRRSLDGTYDSRQFFVDLTERQIERADSESLDIGGFDERYNSLEALSPRTVASHVFDFTRGAYMAGICVDFDTRTVGDLLHSQNLTPPWDYHIVDLRALVVGAHGVGFNQSQDDLADLMNIERQDESTKHTAIGDAEFNASLLRALLGE